MRVEWKAIGNSPAAVNTYYSVLYLHPVLFRKLTPFQQKFVYLHEMGHYYLNTDSEIEADAYAFSRLAGTEWRSLRQCLESLSEVLSPDNPTLKPRYEALYRRALRWDFAHGNEAAGKALSELELDTDMNYFTLINTENTGDAITKAMQSLVTVLQQTESERINETASRKSQQNFLVLILVAVGVYWFVFKD